ncbi:MAG: NAD(P)H-quinone oxidoreductase subunit 3 [Campylobacterales bacterium]
MSHMTFEHPYFGIFVITLLTFTSFFLVSNLYSFISRRLASRTTEKLKLSIYECGPETSLQPNRISAQFYLIALLFILFDVEIIFMFPWAVDFKILSWFGFIEMMAFLFFLTVGFAYAWKKGALEWHSIK